MGNECVGECMNQSESRKQMNQTQIEAMANDQIHYLYLVIKSIAKVHSVSDEIIIEDFKNVLKRKEL